MTESCEWPVDTRCLPEITDDNVQQVRDAVDTAVLVLWALTGRRFGICPAEYPLPASARPCPPDPRLIGGEWHNVPPGPARAVTLPGPVHAVTAVEDAHGEPLTVPELRGDMLLDVPPSAAVVKYLRGEPIPAGAAQHVGTLANERYLQCTGDSRCRLPRNTTNVTRQGVSVQMVSPQEIIESGVTGLPEVDAWIRALNPGGDAMISEVIL